MKDIQASNDPEGTEESLDDFASFSAETITRLFDHFDAKTLFRCRKVSKRFNAIATKVLTTKAMVTVSVQLGTAPEKDVIAWNDKVLKQKRINQKRPYPEEKPQNPHKKEKAYLFTFTSVSKWPSFVSVGKLSIDLNDCQVTEERLADVAKILETCPRIQNLNEFLLKTDVKNGQDVVPQITSTTLKILDLVKSKPVTNLTLSWLKQSSPANVGRMAFEMFSFQPPSAPLFAPIVYSNTLEGTEEAVLALIKSVALRENSVISVNVPLDRTVFLGLLLDVISTKKEGSTSVDAALSKYENPFGYDDPKLKMLLETLIHHPKVVKLALKGRDGIAFRPQALFCFGGSTETFPAKGDDNEDWKVDYSKFQSGLVLNCSRVGLNEIDQE